MKKEIPPLTLPELKIVLGNDWDFFVEKIISNCFCHTCKGVVTIVDYKISVNDLNDVILNGKCEVCRNSVNRYTETGENEEYVKKIKRILRERKQ